MGPWDGSVCKSLMLCLQAWWPAFDFQISVWKGRTNSQKLSSQNVCLHMHKLFLKSIILLNYKKGVWKMKGCFPSKEIFKYSKKSKEMLATYVSYGLPASIIWGFEVQVLAYSWDWAQTGNSPASTSWVHMPASTEFKKSFNFYYSLLITKHIFLCMGYACHCKHVKVTG